MVYQISLYEGAAVLYSEGVRGETPRIGDKLVMKGLRNPHDKEDAVAVDVVVRDVTHHFVKTKKGFMSKASVACDITEQDYEWLRNTDEWGQYEL